MSSTPNTVASAPPRPGRPSYQRKRLALFSLVLGAILAGGLGAVMAVVLSSRSPVLSVPGSFGSGFDKPVPASISSIPLFDASGARVDLSVFHGKVVVLVDFLTSCQDECPISTGALLEAQQSIDRAGLKSKVVILDVSVDPGRDVASRLRAYARYTGVPWPLLSGTPSNLAKLWKFFGATYDKVPEGRPPGLDWQTGKPYSYDVNHSNNVFILDPSGDVRLLTEGLPNVHGALSARLASLLDPLGIVHLHHPGFGAWTSSDLVSAVAYVLGRPITPAG